MQQERLLHFYGFRDHLWGRACYALCCLVSLQWLALIFLLLIDFYQGCQVGGIDNLCFFGTHFIFGGYNLNAQVGPHCCSLPLSRPDRHALVVKQLLNQWRLQWQDGPPLELSTEKGQWAEKGNVCNAAGCSADSKMQL